MAIGFGAFAELYASEYGRLKRIVSRILSRPDAADDVLQETFLKLSDRDLRVADRGLLVHAAKNLALDYNKAETRRGTFASEFQRAAFQEPISPEQCVIMGNQLRSLLDAIHSLPRRRAQIFLLAKLDEMPYARIAEELGVSLSTVEKEIAAAMAFCHRWQRDQNHS